MATKKTKTIPKAKKQFYVHGSVISEVGEAIFPSLEALDVEVGLSAGDTVTILEVVGTRKVANNRIVLE